MRRHTSLRPNAIKWVFNWIDTQPAYNLCCVANPLMFDAFVDEFKPHITPTGKCPFLWSVLANLCEEGLLDMERCVMTVQDGSRRMVNIYTRTKGGRL